MQKPPDSKQREVIPRWRSLKNTPTEELRSAIKKSPTTMWLDNEQKLYSLRWKKNKRLEEASDLISIGITYGLTQPSEEAATFILQNDDATPALKRLAEALLNPPASSFDLSAPKQGKTQLFERIRHLKAFARDNPSNAILQIETALAYASIAQLKQATFHAELALKLAPENRFVLRSASRLFVHMLDFERARTILSVRPGEDPWIDAAHIAVSGILNKSSPHAQPIKKLQNLDLHPSQITELASAMGTLEFKHGAIPKAKKLFKMSLVNPNDNAVAQAQWAQSQIGFLFDPSVLTTELSFEARTGYAFENEEWEKALKECWEWAADEPFTLRPAIYGTYIAAEFCHDFNAAISFADFGLVSNPFDPTLHNNKAFALASLDKLDDALESIGLASQLADSSDPATRASISATRGMIEIRKKNFEEGNKLYKEAADVAIENKLSNHATSALCHWLYELSRQHPQICRSAIDTLEQLFENDRAKKNSAFKIYGVLKKKMLEIQMPTSVPIEDIVAEEIKRLNSKFEALDDDV